MAYTRIRYKPRKRAKGELETVQKLRSTTTGATYTAAINPTEATYKIINVHRGTIIRQGGEKLNNLEVLKRHVKRELKDLGVEFDEEIRPKRNRAVEESSDKTVVGKSSQSGLSSEGKTEGSQEISNGE